MRTRSAVQRVVTSDFHQPAGQRVGRHRAREPAQNTPTSIPVASAKSFGEHAGPPGALMCSSILAHTIRRSPEEQGSPLCFATVANVSAPEGTRVPPLLRNRSKCVSAGGTRVPPLLQLLRPSTTVTIVATLNYGYKCCDLNYGYKCCDPPEGTRVPPLLRILAPPVGRRRVQGSPLCFNCYDPQLRL